MTIPRGSRARLAARKRGPDGVGPSIPEAAASGADVGDGGGAPARGGDCRRRTATRCGGPAAVPLVERLETIPGIGLLNATAFSAMVGDFGRFPSGRRFAGSLGLTPKERSSGKRRWLGSISKAGRHVSQDASDRRGPDACCCRRTGRSGRTGCRQWALEVERRRGRNRAASPWPTSWRASCGRCRREACRFRPRPPTVAERPGRTERPEESSRRRTRRMRQMSSVRPTRGKADNFAGPKRPLFSDWLPVCGFHPGPEPTSAPTSEAVDTCAVATPLDLSHINAFGREHQGRRPLEKALV